MGNQKILIKKSTVAGKAPVPDNLDVGELAVNTADSKTYSKHNDGTIKRLSVGTNATQTEDGLMSSDDKKTIDYTAGTNAVTTLVSLPIAKRVIVASVTAATTISLAAALPVGRELHIKVYNASGGAITQPLPTTAPYESKKVDGSNIASVSIPANGSIEISILSVTNKYIIKTDA